MFMETPAKRVSPRKPLKPVKSVNPCDQNFKGATLRLKIRLKKGKHGSKTPVKALLVIDCCHSISLKEKHLSSELKSRQSSRLKHVRSDGIKSFPFFAPKLPETIFSTTGALHKGIWELGRLL